MKVCGISDIHGNLIENIPKCDVLCICGDTINLSDQRNIEKSRKWWSSRFVEWVEKLPCRKVIVIPGNHDFYLEQVYKDGNWRDFSDYMSIITNGKLVFLLDSIFEYDSIIFYGTPWIEPIRFQEDRWAFSSQEHFKDIQECDVLITHDSPFHNDVLEHYSFGKYRKCHLYGHWHDGENDITSGKYNCSRLNDMYNFKKDYNFVILDIMTERERKTVEQNFLNTIISEATNTQPFIAEWLKAYKENTELQQDIEDSIEWDTSAHIPESSLINDMED